MNETGLRYRFGDFEKKTVLSNSSAECEVTYTPKELNTSDRLVQMGHQSRFEPVTGRIESNERVRFSLPLVNGINLWSTVRLRIMKQSLS